MPRNEEGEFELSVGTRQLVAVIFILTVLFGVVFSMGYFLGRSSAPETPPAASAARAPGAEAGFPAEPSGGRPSAVGPVAPAATPAAATDAGLPAVTPAAAPSQSLQPAPTAAVTPRPVAESKPAAAPPPSAGPPAVAEPAPGQTFLQVAAVRRAEAELIVEVLKKKGFAARIAPVPNETLFRVLVGPLADSAALVKTKADLEEAGFRSIIRKY